ncbi:MAG: hypothetical protein AAB427_04940, partial [Chloroflexota bacterium]
MNDEQRLIVHRSSLDEHANSNSNLSCFSCWPGAGRLLSVADKYAPCCGNGDIRAGCRDGLVSILRLAQDTVCGNGGNGALRA